MNKTRIPELSHGVMLRNFLMRTKMFTAPGIGLKIDKYGHIVSIKDAANGLTKSESTIRRWAKELEQMNDPRFRWDKRFGLLFYYAAYGERITRAGLITINLSI